MPQYTHIKTTIFVDPQTGEQDGGLRVTDEEVMEYCDHLDELPIFDLEALAVALRERVGTQALYRGYLEQRVFLINDTPYGFDEIKAVFEQIVREERDAHEQALTAAVTATAGRAAQGDGGADTDLGDPLAHRHRL